MSFDCRWKTGDDFCARREAPCRPGEGGCVLEGNVVMARDRKGRRTRVGSNQGASTPGEGDRAEPGGETQRLDA